MGQGDAHNAARFGDIVAVCDVDQRHAEAAASRFTKDGKTPATVSRFPQGAGARRTSTSSSRARPITGTRWSTSPRRKAKKDVYGEKPLTLTIDEGRQVVKAVRENKVVLQTGTQQRSGNRFRLACELVRNGRIGKLKQVQRVCARRPAGGPFQAGEPCPPD